MAAASAFGNCVSLPLVVLGALLPSAGGGGVAGSPYETAAAYVSLYALGWSPMLWTLGGMREREDTGPFLFSIFAEREGDGEREGEGRRGREVGRKISPIRFLPPFSPDFFPSKQQQWI